MVGFVSTFPYAFYMGPALIVPRLSRAYLRSRASRSSMSFASLKERIMAGVNDVNRYPVIHTWSYKLAEGRPK